MTFKESNDGMRKELSDVSRAAAAKAGNYMLKDGVFRLKIGSVVSIGVHKTAAFGWVTTEIDGQRHVWRIESPVLFKRLSGILYMEFFNRVKIGEKSLQAVLEVEATTTTTGKVQWTVNMIPHEK